MQVAFHKPTDARAGVNGALYHYFDVAHLLEGLPLKEMQAVPHDFFEIAQLSDSDLARQVRSLGPDDAVLCNVGPYAHFYHYLREKYNGNFRIIRENQTSSWSGYWLQEHLSGPLTREGDIVTFPSEFSRQYYIRLFPNSLSNKNTTVCYPITGNYPEFVQKKKSKGMFRIGYLGRISDDKNFKQVLKLFAEVRNNKGVQSSLHVAGNIDTSSTIQSEQGIINVLAEFDIPQECFIYMGNLPHEKIWDFFASIDVLLFPSVSPYETLGKVVVEASRARVPVAAAHYAAAPEILPHVNLARVHYHQGLEFDAFNPQSFGLVDEEDIAGKIINAKLGDDASRFEEYQPARLIHILMGDLDTAKRIDLSPEVKSFINSVAVRGIDTANFEETMGNLKKLFKFFKAYNGSSALSRISHFIKGKTCLERDHLRKHLYLTRHLGLNDRMGFIHIWHYCCMTGFHPRITLTAD